MSDVPGDPRPALFWPAFKIVALPVMFAVPELPRPKRAAGLGFLAATGLTHALESWLHTRIGLGSRISWWLSLLPLTIAFGVYARRTQRRSEDAPKSRPAA